MVNSVAILTTLALAAGTTNTFATPVPPIERDIQDSNIEARRGGAHASWNHRRDEEALEARRGRGGGGGGGSVGSAAGEAAVNNGGSIIDTAHKWWSEHVTHHARDIDADSLEARNPSVGAVAAETVIDNGGAIINGVHSWWSKHVSHHARDLDMESLEARGTQGHTSSGGGHTSSGRGHTSNGGGGGGAHKTVVELAPHVAPVIPGIIDSVHSWWSEHHSGAPPPVTSRDLAADDELLFRDVDTESLEARGTRGPAGKSGGGGGAHSTVVELAPHVAPVIPGIIDSVHSWWSEHHGGAPPPVTSRDLAANDEVLSRDLYDDDLFERDADSEDLLARSENDLVERQIIEGAILAAQAAPVVGHAVHSWWDKHVSHKNHRRGNLDDEDMLARDNERIFSRDLEVDELD